MGDVVEITSDRYPQFLGQVGTVEAITADADTPISVRSPRGSKAYHRFDLKLISKALPFLLNQPKSWQVLGLNWISEENVQNLHKFSVAPLLRSTLTK